jgi:aryl-alcohol dehydrogenase-like predicted oxidoreductase
MNKVHFGKTGLQVSVLGYGAAPAAFLAAEQAKLADTIGFMLDSGVNFIDTATMYPGSEAFIGQHLSHRREDFVLVSKVGATKIPESTGIAWSEQLITDSIDRALKLMKTDRVDVMLLHSCDLATLKKGDAMAALLKARDAGKIKFAGYSGDNEAATYAATLPEVAVIETSINLFDQVNIDGLLPTAREEDVGIIAKRPIANACWRDPATYQGIYKNYIKPYRERFEAMKLNPADFGFSGDEGKAWAELALRFTLSQPGVHTAIIGTTSRENAAANIAYAANGPLPSDVVEKIRHAFNAGNAAGKWTAQT